MGKMGKTSKSDRGENFLTMVKMVNLSVDRQLHNVGNSDIKRLPASP